MSTENQNELKTAPDAFGSRRSGMPVNEPGILRSSAVLSLNSRPAQRLVYGRMAENGKPPIYGLMRWAAVTKTIFNNSARNDPWADNFLFQVEHELQSCNKELAQLQKELDQLLNSLPDEINIGMARAAQTYQIELNFATPYAYQAAYLLAAYDLYVCSIMTVRHVGLMDRETAERKLSQGGRLLRRLFIVGQEYRPLGVTRNDVIENNDKSKEAVTKYGELEQSIVSATKRPVHSPEIITARNNVNSDASKAPEDKSKSSIDDLLSAGALGSLSAKNNKN